MPFVNPLSRKRARSNSRGPVHNGPLHKIPRLEQLIYDGTASRKSIESSSTGRASKTNVKTKMKRGMSSIITLLGMGSKVGIRASFTHANDSHATTIVNPLRLRLTGDQTPEPVTPHSAPLSPHTEKDIGEELLRAIPPSISARRSRADLRRSNSTPGLHYKISQKLNQTFGNPTIVRKADLKSRPSVQTLHSGLQDAAGMQLSSSLSTYNSGSTSSPKDAQKSTPATSVGATISPASVFHDESIPLVDSDRTIQFTHELTNQPRLTPIPEGAVLPGLSIVTVEATATAKIFLETHFNSFFHGPDTRDIRHYELDKRLGELHLPANTRYRVLRAWERNESDTLRLHRVFKACELGGRGSRSLALGKYEVVKVLGKGSFGVVRLVKEKPHSKTLSRIASTANMIRHVSQTLVKSSGVDSASPSRSRRCDLSKEGHLRAERDFLVAAEGSKWIIPLLEAFQDTKFLYLVMDFCIGGDFLGLLIRKNTLSEEITKWYVAEMILCVEEAHRMKWIHRDVKPDNFLIGTNGHLKISDFGLAFDGEWSHDQRFCHKNRHDLLDKLGIAVQGDDQDIQEQEELENSRRAAHAFPQSGKSSKQAASKDEPPATEAILDWRIRVQRRRLARSVVGTSQYMAPEVIRGDLYDGRCDWWSIGIIMYECLYGYTPFACEDRHNTKLQILKHKHTLKFPECEPARQPSPSARDLMEALLVEKERRLCSRRYELNDFTKRLVGGQHVRFAADKSSKHYTGQFVYPDDAEDIKRHPYFRNIRWELMLEKRPPFVPRVQGWEDTKYFDEEQPISDIDSVSSEDEGCEKEQLGRDQIMQEAEAPAELEPGSKASQHHHEDQHIVPSTALKLNTNTAGGQEKPVITMKTPACDHIVTLPADATLIEHGALENANPQAKKKTKEKKRPRDKILRDPECGKTAMKMRENGAFLGYAYRKPKGVEEVVSDVMTEQDMLSASSPPLAYWTPPSAIEEIC